MYTELEKALKYLETDYLINVSIIEPIKNGTAEVLYASHEGVMVKDKRSEVIMIQTENMALAETFLDNLPQGVTHIVAHNSALAELVERKFGCNVNATCCQEANVPCYQNVKVPCYQGVYLKKTPFYPDTKELEVRLLHEEEAKSAAALYGFSVEEAIEHIRLGLIYGGFVNNELAAMIGMHLQGSMGLLFVSEKYRHRGYAEIMEKYTIDRILERGLVPYCQVVEGNTASLALQSKLGLEMSKNMLYWMIKKS